MGNCFSSDKNETGDHSNSDAVPAKAIESALDPAVKVETNKIQESDEDVNPYIIETEPESKIKPDIKDEDQSAVNNPEIKENDTPENKSQEKTVAKLEEKDEKSDWTTELIDLDDAVKVETNKIQESDEDVNIYVVEPETEPQIIVCGAAKPKLELEKAVYLDDAVKVETNKIQESDEAEAEAKVKEEADKKAKLEAEAKAKAEAEETLPSLNT